MCFLVAKCRPKAIDPHSTVCGGCKQPKAANTAIHLQLGRTALHSQQCAIRRQPGICNGRSLPCIEAPHTVVARPAAGGDCAAPDQQQTVADAVMYDGIC